MAEVHRRREWSCERDPVRDVPLDDDPLRRLHLARQAADDEELHVLGQPRDCLEDRGQGFVTPEGSGDADENIAVREPEVPTDF